VIYELLAELRAEGMTIFLVEQNVARTAEFCDRCFVLSRGRVEAEGNGMQLRRDPALQHAYFGQPL
jgi:branched-chain amino acid transport system ATP-binding protein